jgi:hypothetical protein
VEEQTFPVLNRTQWFGLNYGLNSQFFSIDGFSEKMNSGIRFKHNESPREYNQIQFYPNEFQLFIPGKIK